MGWSRDIMEVVVHPQRVIPQLVSQDRNLYRLIPLVGRIGNGCQLHLPTLRDKDSKDNAVGRLAANWLLLEIHLFNNSDISRSPDSYGGCSKP